MTANGHKQSFLLRLNTLLQSERTHQKYCHLSTCYSISRTVVAVTAVRGDSFSGALLNPVHRPVAHVNVVEDACSRWWRITGTVLGLKQDYRHLLRHDVPVIKRLHKRHDGVFLLAAEFQVAQFSGIYVQRHFRHRPTALRQCIGLGGERVRADRLHVPGVIEVHDPLQALEVAIVPIGLYEAGIRPFVDIAQSGDLLRTQVHRRIGLKVQPALEETAEAEIDPVKAQRVERGLAIPRIVRVPGNAQVVVCIVGEQCVPLGVSFETVAFGALRLALEQVQALLLHLGQVHESRLVGVVLRAEGVRFGRTLESRNGQGKQVIVLRHLNPVCLREGHLDSLGGAGCSDVSRPGNGARTPTPDLLEGHGVARRAHLPDDAGTIWSGLFDRVEERSPGLVRGGVAQPLARGPPIPEVTTGKGAFFVKEQDGALGGIGGAGRLAVAEAPGDRSLVNGAGRIDAAERPGPAHRRIVTGGAGLVGINGEVGIEEYGFAKLLHRGERLAGADAEYQRRHYAGGDGQNLHGISSLDTERHPRLCVGTIKKIQKDRAGSPAILGPVDKCR